MSILIKEMVLKYYPKLWGIKRVNTLLENGKLTTEEYEEVIKEDLSSKQIV